MTKIAEHQQRVLDEASELNEKLTKLTEFIENGKIFPTLEQEDRNLLVSQAGSMSKYLFVLNQRIERFNRD